MRHWECLAKYCSHGKCSSMCGTCVARRAINCGRRLAVGALCLLLPCCFNQQGAVPCCCVRVACVYVECGVFLYAHRRCIFAVSLHVMFVSRAMCCFCEYYHASRATPDWYHLSWWGRIVMCVCGVPLCWQQFAFCCCCAKASS